MAPVYHALFKHVRMTAAVRSRPAPSSQGVVVRTACRGAFCGREACCRCVHSADSCDDKKAVKYLLESRFGKDRSKYINTAASWPRSSGCSNPTTTSGWQCLPTRSSNPSGSATPRNLVLGPDRVGALHAPARLADRYLVGLLCVVSRATKMKEPPGQPRAAPWPHMGCGRQPFPPAIRLMLTM